MGRKLLISFAFSLLATQVSAEEEKHDQEHGHEETSPKFGQGKAIVAVRDEGKSFQLSEESIRFLGLQFSKPTATKVDKGTQFEIVSSALVSFQSEHGVYVRDGSWLELIPVKIIRRTPEKIWITGKGLSATSDIAVYGTAFLRAAHLEATGQGGEGHAD